MEKVLEVMEMDKELAEGMIEQLSPDNKEAVYNWISEKTEISVDGDAILEDFFDETI